ncbi:hypothetical protein DPMN_051658 [Dreissena polymorpha]|uniref:Uncharacterized protein n=1 Tax=Dreissena polymorpha TaxID=45954 RepID=A0A9D4CI81_DREPO|nr:hypothetical protein DPMN_051658 [Dreissena polymorpha]
MFEDLYEQCSFFQLLAFSIPWTQMGICGSSLVRNTANRLLISILVTFKEDGHRIENNGIDVHEFKKNNMKCINKLSVFVVN